ncbi:MULTISPECIES: hypothetical protein [unclassified Pseudoalteromonas]|uniref:hypothetical protein n=1 Tax=unclassified Pseudoalteromonas TaxID=194690 RepID=UPI0015C8E8C1|nr:hypothetical protein [Pseudoalteromonas sp. MIP2626]NYR12771.1 hypothetical protein [Pseudoalteromonas sp. MIP2626]
MIQEDLTKSLLKQITSLNLSPLPNDKYAFKDTIKQKLLDIGEDFTFTFNANKSFEVDIRCDVYKKALFSDYFFGRRRILEQNKSLQNLISQNNQVAWVLVTAYYSAFYMSNEISKLFGIYIANFSAKDMANLFSRADGVIPDKFINLEQSNFSYQVKVTHSHYDGFVKLSFYPKSPRPHVEVWKNLSEVVDRLDVNDMQKHHKTLFLNICDSKNERWHIPSRVRNDWNYKYTDFYGDKGDTLGEIFYKNIRDKTSSFSWANNRNIQPHESNVTASISYIYHCLKCVILSFDKRLGFD